ncbi:MAG: hypothetical protein G01um101433_632 [Parcubacteria group bacterium Gr01-1014_33]|nr:MAG: hypothetical protein G01um101433_632 [Parcubacteria group bacterium Gr01-1014_33]
MTRTRTFIQFVFLLALIAAIIFFGKKGGAEKAQELLVKVGAPFMRASRNAGEYIHFLSPRTNEGSAGNDTQELRMLRMERDQLREENENFRALLDITDKKIPLKGARVLLFLRDFGGEFLLIDAGAQNGINMGDNVVDEKGFYVGTIVELGRTSAKIRIASNTGETHNVVLFPLNTHTIAKGIGGRTLKVELVGGDMPVREGDFVALFLHGTSRPIFAAEVRNVKKEVGAAFQDVYALLLSHPEDAKEVFILPSPESFLTKPSAQ